MAYAWGDINRRRRPRLELAAADDEATKRIAARVKLHSEANMALEKLAAFEAEDASREYSEYCTKLSAAIQAKRASRERLSDKIGERVRNDPNPEITRAYQTEFRTLDDEVRVLEVALAEAQIEGAAGVTRCVFHEDRPDAVEIEQLVRARSAIARSKLARNGTPLLEEILALGYARAMGWSP